jgi:hypothetical protein
VPNLDLRSMGFSNAMPYVYSGSGPDTLGTYLWDGPSQPLLEVANAVMAGGEILPIPSPAPNASWELDFYAPTLKCTSIPEDLHQQVRRNIAQAMGEGVLKLYGYLAWYAGHLGYWDGETVRSMPLMSDSPNSTLKFTGNDETSSEGVSILIAAMSSMFEITDKERFDALAANGGWNGSAPSWVDGTMIRCDVYNSSYKVNFAYVEGSQKIDIAVADKHNETRMELDGTILGPNPDHLAENGCEHPELIRSDQVPSCYTNPVMLQKLSYQAIASAFMSNLKGAMYLNDDDQLQRESNIMNTALLATPDLSFLKTRAAVTSSDDTLQAQIKKISSDSTKGLIRTDNTTSSQPLARAIEQMFQNYTVSLMSSPALQ